MNRNDYAVFLGTAGDGLRPSNGQQFTTFDGDNDKLTTGNCAVDIMYGGWWFSDCGTSNLNGNYREAYGRRSMHWFTWKGLMGLKSTVMKIRN